MCKLVGWGAPEDADPTLKTSEAYDIAYAILYNQLCGFGYITLDGGFTPISRSAL